MAKFEKIVQVKEAVQDDLFKKEYVVAVGIGVKEDCPRKEGYALYVYVKEGQNINLSTNSLLEMLASEDIKVIETEEFCESLLVGAIDDLKNANVDQGCYRPMLAGIQVSLENSDSEYYTGTIGAFVKKKNETDGKVYMLSNRHVFEPLHNEVYQPLPDKNSKVGTVIISEVYEDADAAIASIDEGIEFCTNTIEQIGKITETISVSKECLNKRVIKRGRTTKLTEGTIESIRTQVELTSGKSYKDCVIVRADAGTLFTDEGDSGSPVILKEKNKLIGLHFAGNRKLGGTSIFCTIDNVFRNLDIELAKNKCQ